MRLIPDVHLEQQQKLMITPELRQAIAILQMSSIELSEYLRQELEENPVLELKEDEDSHESHENEEISRAEDNSPLEVEWWEYLLDSSDVGYTGRAQRDDRTNTFEQNMTVAPTLHEHLLFQLHVSMTSEEEQHIGSFLIGSIDDNGYLRITLEDAAASLDKSVERVAEVLELVQKFEPHGVGARDLSECLLLQLKYTGRLCPEIERIISHYLDDLGRGRLAKIAATLRISVKEVQRMADVIRTLDPKPGRQYAGVNDVRYLVPDVTVEKVNGEYIILVNDGNSPRLMVSQVYRDMLSQPGLYSAETKQYVDERLNSAYWLIKSIEHRRLTLYNTARCIVDAQTDFLEKGIKYMKPLNLKQIAKKVGVHESTISRVTNNKYIQTPQGVFELKYFFSSGIESLSGDSCSSLGIKRMIKEIIAEEDEQSPWSDQHISDTLRNRGYQISRRTVTKYRLELGIESTTKRKRY
ncbi:MAG: RNA polymerase factor sigma-54 [Syntrophomonadaceae bacterium]|nr:RNA polymerase factor sigma-54 [Syntrophomonadaceae bacterium]